MNYRVNNISAHTGGKPLSISLSSSFPDLSPQLPFHLVISVLCFSACVLSSPKCASIIAQLEFLLCLFCFYSFFNKNYVVFQCEEFKKAHWENVHSPDGDPVNPMRELWHSADVVHELGLPPGWAAAPCLGLFTHLPLSAIHEQLKDSERLMQMSLLSLQRQV